MKRGRLLLTNIWNFVWYKKFWNTATVVWSVQTEAVGRWPKQAFKIGFTKI